MLFPHLQQEKCTKTPQLECFPHKLETRQYNTESLSVRRQELKDTEINNVSLHKHELSSYKTPKNLWKVSKTNK